MFNVPSTMMWILVGDIYCPPIALQPRYSKCHDHEGRTDCHGHKLRNKFACTRTARGACVADIFSAGA